MKRILIIEDEAPLREGIVDLLDAEGFEPIAAENGAIGVQLAQEHQPDLILCDVLMPILNGYDALALLRQTPETANIPFIFLTAKGEAADFRQGLRLGADDYVAKPFERSELLDAIALRLQKQGQLDRIQQEVIQLQQANATKDEFVSLVSHQLRTPIANMLSMVQLLRVLPDASTHQPYLKALGEQCHHQMNFLNDLLELQQLEADSHQPLRIGLNLYDWVAAVADSFAARLNQYQQTLEMQLAPQLPLLWADSADFCSILSELLNNACKYTAIGGKIFLNVQIDQQPEFFCFQLSNPTEIPAADLPYIFDKFYRVSRLDFHQQGGSGLGLALMQKRVIQMQGTIAAHTQAGWTTFTLRLPLESIAE